MPPPDAIAGIYIAPDGRRIKVDPLTDEDRFTIVRWIDLGCPIDLDYDLHAPEARGFGWMLDDNRPTLTLTTPRAGANPALDRILVGMHDYDTGVDPASFTVTADFPVHGIAAGMNLASQFRPLSQGVWELKLGEPATHLSRARLDVSVKDRQGNTTTIVRSFSDGHQKLSVSGQ